MMFLKYQNVNNRDLSGNFTRLDGSGGSDRYILTM